MPELKTFVTYHTGTGAIRNVYRAPANDTPVVPADHDILKLNPNAVMPAPLTHKVDLGPPLTVVARAAGDMQGEADARRKAVIERTLAGLDSTRVAMVARIFDMTAIDAEIAILEAEHATLP